MKSPESKEARQEIMSRIVVKAWTDPNFKAALLEKPLEILEDEGLTIPEGFQAEVVFHEDTEKTKHFVIPTPPDITSIDEDQLRVLAAQRLSIQLELF